MWRITLSVISVVLLLVDTTLQSPVSAESSFDVPEDDDRRFSYGNNDDVNIADEWREIFADEYNDAMSRKNNDDGEEPPFSGKLNVVEDWPANELHLGQVGGLAADSEGHVHVFHRADRSWDYGAFDKNNTYRERAKGPIKLPTIYTLNVSNGAIVNKWAANMFYLPHGLTVDDDGNFWMTDVAMHQVFKFEAGKHDKPALTLGKRFEAAASNEDVGRFCKPTDVAVAANGDFYISDGYCASRVMKYNKGGQLIGQFGVNDFQIPHSIALAEDLDLICVADRENMRILCYNAGIQDVTKLGEPLREYNDELLGRIFAITYSPTDGLLYGVTGPTGILLPQGFTIDLQEDERYSVDLIATWSPDDKGFDQPHDVAVTPDGSAVFVGEITPDLVWKFIKEEQL